MISSPLLLRAAAAEIEELQAELAVLQGKYDTLFAHHRNGFRKMYRSGYYAGRSSVKAGNPEVVDPESHARGKVRELLGT